MKFYASDNPSSENIVTDVEGNNYDSIAIGSQIWMTENLRVTKYRNGESILKSEVAKWLDSETGELYTYETGDCCTYDYDEENVDTHGCLYNWYAVNDSRQIAPLGWHVPSIAEWNVLFNFLGGELIVGDKLKEIGFNNWGSRKIGADNSSGFSALPSGYRGFVGTFKGLNYYCYWWAATEFDSMRSWFCYLSYGNKYVTIKNDLKCYGFSVRCVRDY